MECRDVPIIYTSVPVCSLHFNVVLPSCCDGADNGPSYWLEAGLLQKPEFKSAASSLSLPLNAGARLVAAILMLQILLFNQFQMLQASGQNERGLKRKSNKGQDRK